VRHARERRGDREGEPQIADDEGGPDGLEELQLLADVARKRGSDAIGCRTKCATSGPPNTRSSNSADAKCTS